MPVHESVKGGGPKAGWKSAKRRGKGLVGLAVRPEVRGTDSPGAPR